MGDLVDTMQQEMVDRLNELAPLVVEFERLTLASAALDDLGEASASSMRSDPNGRSHIRPGRPLGSKSRTQKAVCLTAVDPVEASEVGKPRRGKARRKAANTRAIQAVALITEQPGITIPELAAKMKVNRTGMYRILPGPEMEGKIRREGSGWWPTGS